MNALTARVLPWLNSRLATHQAPRPLVVGINGPQGGGKSTLAAQLVSAVSAQGLRAFAVSIDDFYLTHAAQQALAAAHPGSRTLEHRGYPGTHDIALGVTTLTALRCATPGVVRVPRYDKSAHGGRGDRAPESEWPCVDVPLALLIVEGWMLGFRPTATDDPELVAPNAALARYAEWTALIDDMVVLTAEAPEHIVAWRVGAERSRRESGAPALSEADARDYIERFLPAYALWAPGLRADLAGAVLRITLRADRSPA